MKRESRNVKCEGFWREMECYSDNKGQLLEYVHGEVERCVSYSKSGTKSGVLAVRVI